MMFLCTSGSVLGLSKDLLAKVALQVSSLSKFHAENVTGCIQGFESCLDLVNIVLIRNKEQNNNHNGHPRYACPNRFRPNPQHLGDQALLHQLETRGRHHTVVV